MSNLFTNWILTAMPPPWDRNRRRGNAWQQTFMLLAVLAMLGLSSALPEAWGEPGKATIIAHIVYRGAVPMPQQVEVTRDPDYCGTTRTIQPIIVDQKTNGVRHAVLFLDGTAPAPFDSARPPIVVTNHECVFQPHVTSIQVGQKMTVRNQDPLMHNTHITIDKLTLLNVAMQANTPPVSKVIKRSGLYSIQCDAHKFMKGYAVAVDHPYVGVSDAAGEVRLTDVPAGTYDIIVWHEALGMLKHTLTVPPDGNLQVTLEYSLPAKTWEMRPR